jgi:hypothetical protein
MPFSLMGVQQWPMLQYLVSYMAPKAHKICIILVIAVAFNQLASWSLGGNLCFGDESSELLRYEVTWNGNKAGHGDITTRKGSDQINVVAQAVSDEPLKKLLEIWSRVQATFSSKKFQPKTYQFVLKSNLLRQEMVDLLFDHENNVVQIKKQSGEERESKSEKAKGLYDPVTAVFLLRSQRDLRKPLFVDIFDGKDKARLYVSPAGEESIRTKAGFYKALCLHLKLVKLGGDKKELATGKLWISDDPHRLPLLLTSSPILGTIRFELVHAQL